MCEMLGTEADAVTSLDTWPTSDPERSIERLNRETVFSMEQDARDRWEEAITADPLNYKHIGRYQNCGTNAWIEENTTNGHCRIVFNTCKLRICPVCSRIAARRVKHRLESALHQRTLKKWRLITLTTPSVDADLKTQVRSLIACFKTLRKTPNWRKYITGGYAVLEITHNPTSDRWHPHLHIIAGGLFYPWRELREDWKIASQGATVTDIRAIKGTAQAVRYLTAYLGKMGNLDARTPTERLTEYYRATHGQRFLITFGKAPPAKKLPRSNEPSSHRQICPLYVYILALRDGAVWALALSRKLARKPLDDLAIADHHPPPPPA